MSEVADLLEKFEDVFQPHSKDEVEKRIASITDIEELGYIALNALGNINNDDKIIELFIKYHNTSISKYAYEWLEGWLEIADEKTLRDFIRDV